MRIACTLAVALFFSASAAAQDTGAAQQAEPVSAPAVTPAEPASAVAAADEPKKTCTMERLTGSGMRRRVCLTEEERRRHEALARDFMAMGHRNDSSGDGVR